MRTTEQFLLHLHQLGVRVWEEEGDLHYGAPTGVLTTALYAELAERKAEIIDLLRQAHAARPVGDSVVQVVPRDVPLPLSFAQQRLWFLDQLEPNSAAYNIPAAYLLVGPLHVAALERAINEVVRRHEVLRTTFPSVDGQPVQVIAPSLHVPLAITSLESVAKDERKLAALRLAAADAYGPFDLSQGPLLRAQLLRLEEEEHILVLTMHHIVTDGWSEGVLRRELAELYDAFSQGRPSPLPELPVQYADFTVWQRKWLESGVLARELVYWRDRLQGASELQLPSDRPRPALLTYEGARQALSFPTELSEALKALSRREGVTLFMTLLAAFKVLLYRYTSQEDIVVGTPIANRDRAELEGLIGFFVNTLVLRTDLTQTPCGTLTFGELLARVREVCLGAYAHQHLPFEKLVEELRPQRDRSRNPLFQVMFVLQNAPRPAMEMTGLRVTPLDLPVSKVGFDLECDLWEEGEAIRGALIYNTNLSDAATMARMAGHYQTLLEGVVADPGTRLSDLPLLTEAERRQLLVEWNRTETEYPRDISIHRLFEAQVERTPDAVAVCFEDQKLTYCELNRKANQLARYLQKLGVRPQVLVGLCVERSLEMVVAILAILKAGGAYVPLDPVYPAGRIAFVLKDAGAGVLVTQRSLLSSLPAHTATVVFLDDGGCEAFSQDNPLSQVTPKDLAYVIYTSGSTGRPKGVAIEHRSTVAFISWAAHTFSAADMRGVLASTSICFDLSVFEILATLSMGGSVILVSSALALESVPDPSAISLINTVPSMLAALLDRGFPPAVHTICSAGEPLSSLLVQQLYRVASVQKVFDLYGPTEATTYSTFCLRQGDQPATIGRPIANTRVYILDPHVQPVPIGVPGELYLGGDGLARGYLRGPDSTAQRFVPDPFSRRPGARLYRTGDLARYLPSGNIEFLGRRDDQIKIRGFRIELGEIETTLEEHSDVGQAVVLDRDGPPGTARRLVAYVVVKEMPGPTVSELRSFLKERLPEYMLPSAFVFLNALPLTPSGKIDRRALPAPDQTLPQLEQAFVAPHAPVEVKLADIWAKVLKLDRVGVHDDFFELGGHSLLAIQVASRIRDAFCIELPVRAIFEAPTIMLLSRLIERMPSMLAGTESPEGDTAEGREELLL